eukprot:3239054-Rhodomonas_salina.1
MPLGVAEGSGSQEPAQASLDGPDFGACRRGLELEGPRETVHSSRQSSAAVNPCPIPIWSPGIAQSSGIHAGTTCRGRGNDLERSRVRRHLQCQVLVADPKL